jgi:hypothetical protein
LRTFPISPKDILTALAISRVVQPFSASYMTIFSFSFLLCINNLLQNHISKKELIKDDFFDFFDFFAHSKMVSRRLIPASSQAKKVFGTTLPLAALIVGFYPRQLAYKASITGILQ